VRCCATRRWWWHTIAPAAQPPPPPPRKWLFVSTFGCSATQAPAHARASRAPLGSWFAIIIGALGCLLGRAASVGAALDEQGAADLGAAITALAVAPPLPLPPPPPLCVAATQAARTFAAVRCRPHEVLGCRHVLSWARMRPWAGVSGGGVGARQECVRRRADFRDLGARCMHTHTPPCLGSGLPVLPLDARRT
jgi:hypothetical protein